MPQKEPQPRILTAIRHAKSSWEDPNMRNFDSSLNK